ncbi:MAG: ATP-binding protein [Verrucomicrobiales bacterium]|nr:ATP-binding protein [Verrucomicrobiales bacterium]
MNSVEEIQSINHHMRLALDQVSEGVLIVEAESHTPIGPRVVFANEAMKKFTGYEVADILGQPLGLLFDRDYLPEFLRRLPLISQSTESFPVQKDLHLQDGGRERFNWTIVPVKDSLGQTINFTIRLQSVEKSAPAKVVEDSLHEDLAKSRLESLQIVSSGIAHDFRNGLVATKLALDLIRMAGRDNPEILQYAEDADISLDANADLATQMLEFTRGEDSKLRVVNLHGLLKKTARMSTVGNNVTPELSVQQDLWDVEIDSVQIRQVFQNIIINGCEAMPNGGPMHISARNASVSDGNSFGLPAGNYVVVGIRDRGCGIPRESIGKVFDPYFTTKPDGTGIGLASCKQIVERHKGKIMVESAENVGTEFIIFLPVATVTTPVEDDVRSVLPQQIHARATRHFLEESSHEKSLMRVLVVDDDARICKLASKILAHIGLEPVVAEDGEQAVMLVRQAFRETKSFSIVILDLNLPRMSGLEVMREIRKIDPGVKIILSSGDSSPEICNMSEWDGVLTKPYGKDSMELVLSNAFCSAHHDVPVM